MSLPVAQSEDAHSFSPEQARIPALLPETLRDNLAARIDAALAAGDHERTSALVQTAQESFPADPAFSAYHMQCARLARRSSQVDAALRQAHGELSDDRFASAFAMFLEAFSLGHGYPSLTRKTADAAVHTAREYAWRHWRFAEALLAEARRVSGISLVGTGDLWVVIESQKREQIIGVTIDESGRAEHVAYLPHLRRRLADLERAYPSAEPIKNRLRDLDELVSRQVAGERNKNLGRALLFRERLDLTGNLETLRGFEELVAPFVSPYPGDREFAAVLAEIRGLRSKYESAAALFDEDRLDDAALVCDQVLRHRPANVLFRELEEKVKSRISSKRRVLAIERSARGFEAKARYAQAFQQWEALRAIQPGFPGLASEILHCAALASQANPEFAPDAVNRLPSIPEFIDIAAGTHPRKLLAAGGAPSSADLRALTLWRPQLPAAPRRVVIKAEQRNTLKIAVSAVLAVWFFLILFLMLRRG